MGMAEGKGKLASRIKINSGNHENVAGRIEDGALFKHARVGKVGCGRVARLKHLEHVGVLVCGNCGMVIK